MGLPRTEDAAAADIPYPVKAPAVVDVPPSWAGFYLGSQVGYGMDSVGWRNLNSSALFSPLNSLTRDRGGGVIGGSQVGYNFQFNRIVFGLEGSISAADFDRSFASPYFPATDVWSSKITWLSTVTGRIGYGFDSWLPYIKGGLQSRMSTPAFRTPQRAHFLSHPPCIPGGPSVEGMNSRLRRNSHSVLSSCTPISVGATTSMARDSRNG